MVCAGNTIEESVRELEDESDMDSDESDRHEHSQPGTLKLLLKLCNW